jgi:cytochrome c-type biogenesis protein CcmE
MKMKINSKRKKLALAIISILVFSITMFLSLSKDQIIYFYTVKEILQSPSEFQKRKIRIMGLVEKKSVNWNPQNTTLSFTITEEGKEDNLQISYMGIKPDLFREGQGAVVEGFLSGDVFQADKLLVKHSEEYKVENHSKKKQDYLQSISP